MSLALGLSLWSIKQAPRVFNPASLSLSGWWRAPYGGSPWTGTASAGSSTGRNASGIGNDPAVGAALNGLTPADFDGALNGDALALGTAISSFISSVGWTLGVLLHADSVSVDDASVANNHLLFGDGAGFWGLYAAATAGGQLQLMTNDGSEKVARAALATGGWVYAHCMYDGTTMTIDTGGTPGTQASGAPSTQTNGLRFGRRGALTSFDGRVAEIMVGASNALWSRAQALSYINARYGLSL